MLDDEIFILLKIQSTGSTKHQPTTQQKWLQIIQTALSELASAIVNYFKPMQVPVHLVYYTSPVYEMANVLFSWRGKIYE